MLWGKGHPYSPMSTESTPPPPPPPSPVNTEGTPPPPPPATSVGTPPPPPVAQTPAPAAPAAAGTGLPPNIAAAIAAFFAPLGGIIFLVIEKKDAYVRFHAMQSTIFGVGLIAFGIACTILSIILGFIWGWLAWLVSLPSFLVYMAAFVLWVIHVIKAFSGVEWEMPYIGKFARQQLLKYPPAP